MITEDTEDKEESKEQALGELCVLCGRIIYSDPLLATYSISRWYRPIQYGNRIAAPSSR